MRLTNFIWLLVIGSYYSCTYTLDETIDSPTETFDYVWNNLDQRFSLFEINDVNNWEDSYQIFRDKVFETMTDDSLHSVLNDLLWVLKDRHSSIQSPFPYERRFKYISHFSREALDNNYLKNKKTLGRLEYSILEDNIAYVYLPTFSKVILEDQVSTLINDISTTDGLIFDIRENGGGNELYAQRLAQAFCDERRLYRVTYTKSGPAHDDFVKLAEVFISPWDKEKYNKPIVLITNKGTYSASSDFTFMLRQFPQVTILGDSIGGGLGTPVFMQMPNGWTFRFSSSYSLDPEGKQFENGMPPDTLVYLDTLQAQNNIDNLIEAAKDLLSD